MRLALAAVLVLPAAAAAANANSDPLIINVHTNNNTTSPSSSTCPHHDGVFVDPKKENKNLDSCSVDDDCDPDRLCATNTNCDDKCDGYKEGTPSCMCLHKDLTHDFSSRDAGAMACVFVGCMLAASAGIGGGGLFVPIYMLITNFIIEEAIPLSHATVMGNSVAQLLVNIPQRHDHAFVTTDRRKHIIDFSVPLLLLPGQLGGNNLGVMFEPIFPTNILIIVSEVLLAFATFRVFEKGIKMYRAENQVIAEQQVRDSDDESETVKQPAVPSDGSRASQATSMSVGAIYVGLPKESQLNEEQHLGNITASSAQYFHSLTDPDHIKDFQECEIAETTVPWRYVGFMACFWAVFAAAFVIMKEFGNKCSAGYLTTVGLLYPVLIAVTVIGSKMVAKHNNRREQCRVQPPAGEIQWTRTKLIAAPLAAVGVGFIAGLLGLGGGELMAPLLLELGLLPKAASSTSAYMIIWTTSSDIVHYAIGGDLAGGYATVFCLLGFVGGGLGRWIAMKYTSKGRQSPIAFALGSVLALSMALLLYRMATSHPNDPWWPFKSMCD
eukprot:Hpha_TRINITY_DN17530_c0_g1::TRINITY_DN17530_c0_g1_i1::g.92472::m.92472